jgi:hypothetical protein
MLMLRVSSTSPAIPEGDGQELTQRLECFFKLT